MLNITMPRGDIRSVIFTVTGADGELSDITFDEIYFTVKKYFTDRHYCFQKRFGDGTIELIESGTYSFTVIPSDTDNLEVGQYVFDVELISGTDIKQTTVGKFILTDEVTYAENEV